MHVWVKTEEGWTSIWKIPPNPLFFISKGMETLTRKIKANTCGALRLPLWPNCVFQSWTNTRNIIQTTYNKGSAAAATYTSTYNAVMKYVILSLLLILYYRCCDICLNRKNRKNKIYQSIKKWFIIPIIMKFNYILGWNRVWEITQVLYFMYWYLCWHN